MKPGSKVSKLAQFTVQSCINKSSKWSVLSVKWSFAGPAKRYFLWASCENFVMFPIAIKQSFSKNIFFQIGHWQIVDLLEINAPSQLLFTKLAAAAVCYCFCWLFPLNINFCITGRTRTKDKYRVVYSDHQRLELEKEFHYSRYITIRRKAELANSVGLSERQVRIYISFLSTFSYVLFVCYLWRVGISLRTFFITTFWIMPVRKLLRFLGALIKM